MKGLFALVFLTLGCLEATRGDDDSILSFMTKFQGLAPFFSTDIFKTFTGMYTNDKVYVGGRECILATNPKFKSLFNIRKKSKFFCPGFSPYTAVAIEKTKREADRESLRMYIEDCKAKGLIYEEEVEDWVYNF